MQTISKRPLLISAALGILVLAGTVYFVRPNATTRAEQTIAIPDRVEAYEAIDEVCSKEQGRDKCLTELLAEVEHDLEQALGAKLKDTWPATRDASCSGIENDEQQRCRIYETLKFKQQVLLYQST